MSLAKLMLGLLSAVAVSSVTIQDVPVCAQNCLANSTSAQSSCQVIDIACLCANQAYVSTLSCCLATQCDAQEQATAIQFNQQECQNVNETAPDFVGCSPFNATGQTQSGAAPTKTATTLATSATSINPLISTITDSAIAEPAFLTGPVSTAPFNGKPLLTGSCTVPYFAAVTDLSNDVFEFPAVGCAPDRQNCCPYAYGQNAVITQCPQDYFTTAGGCCPVGYQVYYTQLGAYTPCYSVPSTTVVPATSPTGSGLTLITDHVFAQKFMLAKPKSGGLSGGTRAGIIGGTVNLVAIGAIGIFIVWFVKRRRARRILEANRATTFPPVEPTMAMSETHAPQTPHELPSPDPNTRSPASATERQMSWPVGAIPASSPPGYSPGGRQSLSKVPSVPQELPGSTFIHEHHPAFSSRDPSEAATGTPSSPPMTPTRSRRESDGSPMVTPLSTPPIGAGTRSPIISPLQSPRLPPGRLGGY